MNLTFCTGTPMVVWCLQVLVLLVQCGLVSGQGPTPLPEQHSSISSVLLNLVLISTFIVLIVLMMKKPRIDAGTSAQAQLAQAQAGSEAARTQAATWKEDMQPAMSELAQALRGLGKRRYEVARQRYKFRAEPHWPEIPDWRSVNAQLAQIFLEAGISVLGCDGVNSPPTHTHTHAPKQRSTCTA